MQMAHLAILTHISGITNQTKKKTTIFNRNKFVITKRKSFGNESGKTKIKKKVFVEIMITNPDKINIYWAHRLMHCNAVEWHELWHALENENRKYPWIINRTLLLSSTWQNEILCVFFFYYSSSFLLSMTFFIFIFFFISFRPIVVDALLFWIEQTKNKNLYDFLSQFKNTQHFLAIRSSHCDCDSYRKWHFNLCCRIFLFLFRSSFFFLFLLLFYFFKKMMNRRLRTDAKQLIATFVLFV